MFDSHSGSHSESFVICRQKPCHGRSWRRDRASVFQPWLVSHSTFFLPRSTAAEAISTALLLVCFSQRLPQDTVSLFKLLQSCHFLSLLISFHRKLLPSDQIWKKHTESVPEPCSGIRSQTKWSSSHMHGTAPYLTFHNSCRTHSKKSQSTQTDRRPSATWSNCLAVRRQLWHYLASESLQSLQSLQCVSYCSVVDRFCRFCRFTMLLLFCMVCLHEATETSVVRNDALVAPGTGMERVCS